MLWWKVLQYKTLCRRFVHDDALLIVLNLKASLSHYCRMSVQCWYFSILVQYVLNTSADMTLASAPLSSLNFTLTPLILNVFHQHVSPPVSKYVTFQYHFGLSEVDVDAWRVCDFDLWWCLWCWFTLELEVRQHFDQWLGLWQALHNFRNAGQNFGGCELHSYHTFCEPGF